MSHLTNQKKQFAFDSVSNNKLIEFKARNNYYNKYPTTIIGYNKIIKASTLNKNVYFYLVFFYYIYYFTNKKKQKLEIKYNYC